MEKKIWKNRSICPSHLISQEKSIMEIMATSRNYGKKGSDHFRDILNHYGEKSNYGKIGRRRRLSKLNVFFSHNSVGDHRFIMIYLNIYVNTHTHMYIYIYTYMYIYIIYTFIIIYIYIYVCFLFLHVISFIQLFFVVYTYTHMCIYIYIYHPFPVAMPVCTSCGFHLSLLCSALADPRGQP